MVVLQFNVRCVIMFTSVLLASACGWAAAAMPAPAFQENAQSGIAEIGRSPERPSRPHDPQKDPRLLIIDRFEVDLSKRLAGFQDKGSKPIQVIMNPFTARKRARLYGSVYEYHRNDNFDARNFFDPSGKRSPSTRGTSSAAAWDFSSRRRSRSSAPTTACASIKGPRYCLMSPPVR